MQKLQSKQTTTIKDQLGTRPSLPRSAPIHFMSAEGCIGIADYGTIDDNFDSVAWIDSSDVTYDLATQQVTYGSTATVIHNIQQTERSQAFTRISMCPEDTNGKINGPPNEVKCKIRHLCRCTYHAYIHFQEAMSSMFDYSGKALKKPDADWTTIAAYGGSKIRQYRVRIIKCFWNKQKWKFLFHTKDVTGPILLRMKNLKMHGNLCEASHGVQ